VDELNEHLPTYSVNTPKRIAAFLSQCAHESMDFTHLHENLNYGAKGLLATFPKYFDANLANQYARIPEKIANRVYANRMGNGDEASGDGYKFRGRGILQITGKANYHVCSHALYDDDTLIDHPELLEEVDGAIRSALWYWNTHLLNVPADAGDVLTLTKKINGGTIGLDDRTTRYNNALAILQG
jgi:putative chitinase